MSLGFENRRIPLASRRKFLKRLARYFLAGCLFILFSLYVGAVGYRYYVNLSWVDAFYNASMILTGMGPAVDLQTDSSKIFVTVYSIYSGVAFLTSVGVIFAPLIHRLLHKLHAPIDN